MENKDNISSEIEATLNSVDNIGRAQVSPYFYTRLEARLQQPKVSAFDNFLQQVLNRPTIAVSMLMVFLVLNIIALKGISSGNNSSPARSSNALQNFATEYNMSTGSVYNNSGR
jgi:hypothetical protein